MSQHPLRFWAWAFVLVNLTCDIGGGTNASSRYASLLAMTEDHQFSINHYLGQTADWAKVGDRYYSNKAPGPVLVAFPFFWVVDTLTQSGNGNRVSRDKLRRQLRYFHLKWLSLLLQVLPMLLLFWWAVDWFESQGRFDLSIFSAITLFGTTSALMMNHFSGHGFAAVCVFGCVLGLVRKRWFFSGTAFGFAYIEI